MELKNISSNRLYEVLSDILDKEGYFDLAEDPSENIIIGYREEGLSKTSHLFYLYSGKLSGEDVDKIKLEKSLNKVLSKFPTDIQTLVSINNISRTTKSFLEKEIINNIKFLESDQLNDLINKYYPNFWAYEQFDLIKYERYFLEEMSEQSALKNIQGLEGKV